MKKYEKQLSELWGKVGFIVNLSQMLEYNLANILAFEEILREFENSNSITDIEFSEFVDRANKVYSELDIHPFGAGLNRAKKIKFFTSKSQKELKRVCEERNYVVHRLFKDDLIAKKLETDPTFYFERLEKLIEDMYQINNDLTDIFAKQKAEYKLIW